MKAPHDLRYELRIKKLCTYRGGDVDTTKLFRIGIKKENNIKIKKSEKTNIKSELAQQALAAPA
jgi:hypothetical protein